MTSERARLFHLKKSLINNGRRLFWIRNYKVNGEDACREICMMRSVDKSNYLVWHYDFLEKFVDVPDLHFSYENFECDTFEQAVELTEEKFGISLSELS